MSSILINAFWWGLIAIVLLSLIFAGPLRTFSHTVGTSSGLIEKSLKFIWFFISRIGTCAVCVILFQHGLGKSLKSLPHTASVVVAFSTLIFLGGAYLYARYFRPTGFRKPTVRVMARALIIASLVVLLYELIALSGTGRDIALEPDGNPWPSIQNYHSGSVGIFELPHYHLLLIAFAYQEADILLLIVLGASFLLCIIAPFLIEEIPGTAKARKEAERLHGTRTFATPKELLKGAREGEIYLGVQRDSGLEEEIRVTPKGHLLTFAGTGGGKTRSVLIQNALEYPHQLVLFDPKCEVSTIVSEARAERTNRPYYIINPERSAETDSLNLIDWIDPDSETAFEDCGIVANAFTSGEFKQGGSSNHFEEKAIALNKLGIYIVVADPTIKTKSIVEVRKQLAQGDFEGWLTRTKERAHEFPDPEQIELSISELLSDVQGRHGGSIEGIRTTQQRMLQWTDSSSLKRVASGEVGRAIDLDEIISGDADIYLDISEIYLSDEFRGFARAVFNIIMNKMIRHRRQTSARPKTLFLLDEFAQIRHMPCFPIARGMGRTYGFRLWTFFQDIGQIKSIWGKEDAQGWFANAEVRQYFNINENETARYISEELGTETVLVASDSATESNQRGRQAGGSGQGGLSPYSRALKLPQEVRDVGAYEQLIAFGNSIGLPPVHAKLKEYKHKYPKLAANDPEA